MFAVDIILKIRGKRVDGDLTPRPRRLPELNISAVKLQDMITWKGAQEPVLSCKLTKVELMGIKAEAMKVPYYPVHTQGIERAVKEVIEASQAVFGFSRRDGFIRAQAENRELMPILSSKKQMGKLLEN